MVDGGRQLQKLRVVQLVHDSDLLAHLGPVGQLDALDELGRVPVTCTLLHHLRGRGAGRPVSGGTVLASGTIVQRGSPELKFTLGGEYKLTRQ